MLVFLVAQLTLITTPVPQRLFEPGDTIVFQGDSITDGNRGRTPDPNHILGHGYAFSIASRFGEAFPNDGLNFINRGISGNALADLAARWKEDAVDLHPTVLSILVGINDIGASANGVSTFDAADFERRYRALITQSRSANASLRLVLCEPFTLNTGFNRSSYEGRRKLVEAADSIVRRLATEYNAADIPLQQVFDGATVRAPAEHWIWDGIHPTYSGHQLIADAWIQAYRNKFVSPLFDPTRNTAVSPEVNFERDSYDWLHRHADVLATQRLQPPDVVLIGDSITHFWGGLPKAAESRGPRTWERVFAKSRPLNMGFGWDRTQNVLWRLEHGELAGCHPKSIIVNIGTNNLVGDETARENSPEETAAGIEAVLAAVRRTCPDARVTVMAIFPRGYAPNNTLDLRIRRTNQLIATAIQNVPQTYLLDIGPKLRDAAGAASRDLFIDGTHPNERGYAIWADALQHAGAIPAKPV